MSAEDDWNADNDLTLAVTIWTNDQSVEWPLVVQEMLVAGHRSFTESRCRQRMNELVNKYIDLLVDCRMSYRAGCDQWPIFANLNDMNLSPFLSKKTYEAINIMRSNLFISLPEPDLHKEEMKLRKPKISVENSNDSVVTPIVKFTEENRRYIDVKENHCQTDDHKDIKHTDWETISLKQIFNNSMPKVDYSVTEMKNKHQKDKSIAHINFKCLVDFEGNKFFVETFTEKSKKNINRYYLRYYSIAFESIRGQIESAIGSRLGFNTHLIEVINGEHTQRIDSQSSYKNIVRNDSKISIKIRDNAYNSSNSFNNFRKLLMTVINKLEVKTCIDWNEVSKQMKKRNHKLDDKQCKRAFNDLLSTYIQVMTYSDSYRTACRLWKFFPKAHAFDFKPLVSELTLNKIHNFRSKLKSSDNDITDEEMRRK